MLLCDAADAVNGKLYILGGGWSHAVVTPGEPLAMALAVLIHVPWDRANTRMKMQLELRDEDGAAVRIGESEPIRADGEIEAGRPPGLRPGSDLDVALAPRFALPLPPGGYAWHLTLDDEPVARVVFTVAARAQAQ